MALVAHEIHNPITYVLGGLHALRELVAPLEQTLDILSKYIEQRVQEDKFDIVAIDSLAALYSLFTMDNPRRALYHFFGFLKELGATTLLVSEIPYGKDQLVPFDEDFLADGILLLKQYEVGETDVQLRIRCIKMRKSKHFQGYLTLMREDDKFMVTRVISE